MLRKCKKSIVINTPPAVVYRVVIDYENYKDFMPGVLDSRVIVKEKDTATVEFKIRIVKEFYYKLYFQHDENKRVQWTYAGGDFKNITGEWEFIETLSGKKTTAWYTLCVDPGFAIPKLMINTLIGTNVPQVLRAVKERAETISRELSDL